LISCSHSLPDGQSGGFGWETWRDETKREGTLQLSHKVAVNDYVPRAFAGEKNGISLERFE
jgi:hypothetical protein